MAKFYGKVGYVAYSETSPGIYEEIITERSYFGDIIKNYTRWENGQEINDDLTIRYEIGIISDPYSYQHLSEIKYVDYWGAKWKVTNISIERPRLILTLGGLYNEQQTN